MRPLYCTELGTLYNGDSANILKENCFSSFRHEINLIFTSPPFPLTRSKAHGNLNGEDYIEWLSSFGPIFKELIAPDGSLVIELGNAWLAGSPTMSLTSIQSLMELKKKGNFHSRARQFQAIAKSYILEKRCMIPFPLDTISVTIVADYHHEVGVWILEISFLIFRRFNRSG